MGKFVRFILIYFIIIYFSINTYSQNTGTVYFKIQIAASKVPLSNYRLETICPVNDKLSVEYENHWYKYILSKKFFTYKKAFAYKNTINIKGAFILAYKNEQKINITEVVRLDENETVDSIKNNSNKIVYRLQLGVSVKKPTERTMSWIKSGGKPITTVKYNNYYLYTIGDFISEKEAKNFKNKKQLNDAKIVKFKNGKPF